MSIKNRLKEMENNYQNNYHFIFVSIKCRNDINKVNALLLRKILYIQKVLQCFGS